MKCRAQAEDMTDKEVLRPCVVDCRHEGGQEARSEELERRGARAFFASFWSMAGGAATFFFPFCCFGAMLSESRVR